MTYSVLKITQNPGTPEARCSTLELGRIGPPGLAPAVDETDWHTFYDETLLVDGTFSPPSIADFTEIEVSLTGQSADAAASSSSIRVRFNNDSGLNYHIANSAIATTAWNNNGFLPGRLTNTDRTGQWKCLINLGGVGRRTTALFENVYWASTASAASLPATGGLHYINTSAPITAIDVYPVTPGALYAAGTRMTLRGRKASA